MPYLLALYCRDKPMLSELKLAGNGQMVHEYVDLEGSGLIHWLSELSHKERRSLRGKVDLLLMGKAGSSLRETA